MSRKFIKPKYYFKLSSERRTKLVSSKNVIAEWTNTQSNTVLLLAKTEPYRIRCDWMIGIDFKAVTAAVYITNINHFNQDDNGDGMH